MKTDNEAIYGILNSIYEKWRAGTGKEEEMVETVLLTPKGLKKETTLTPAPPSHVSEDSEVVSETVVLSTRDIKPTPAGKPEKREKVPPETVIISTTGAKYSAMPSHEAHPSKQEEVLPETIIMSARDIMDFNSKNKKGPDEKNKMKSKKEDCLSETVILNTADFRGKDKNGNK